jgi:hypothetical protein
VPPQNFLAAAADGEPAAALPPARPIPVPDGSLGIGSLKGDIRHE